MSDSNYLLESDDIITSFLQQLSAVTVVNYSYENLIADAIASIEYEDSTYLLERCKRLHGSQMAETGWMDDGLSATIVSNAWFQLVCRLRELINMHDIRLPSGHLDYYFNRLIGNDILLSRYTH